MSMIAKIDFDGTIVKHAYPGIGEPLEDAFEVMKEMKAAGWKLILWTCREDSKNNINKRHLTAAVEFCRMQGIEFDAVNETIPEEDFREDEPRRKPYAHVHIDDRNLLGFPGWKVVREVLLIEKFVL